MEKQGTGYAAREGGMGGDAYPCVRAFDATEVGSGITGERGGVARYKERQGIGGDALRGGEVGNVVREKRVRGDKTRGDEVTGPLGWAIEQLPDGECRQGARREKGSEVIH